MTLVFRVIKVVRAVLVAAVMVALMPRQQMETEPLVQQTPEAVAVAVGMETLRAVHALAQQAAPVS